MVIFKHGPIKDLLDLESASSLGKILSMLMDNSDSDPTFIKFAFNRNIVRYDSTYVALAIETDTDEIVGYYSWSGIDEKSLAYTNPTIKSNIEKVGYSPLDLYLPFLIVVRKDYRGQGIVRQLSKLCRKDAKAMGFKGRLLYQYTSESIRGASTHVNSGTQLFVQDSDGSGNSYPVEIVDITGDV